MPRLFYTGNRDNVGLERWANDMDTSVQSIQRQLAQSREQAAKALTQAATTNAALGLPSQPTNFSINATEYYQDGSTYEQITATYTAPTPLGTFAGVFIVVSGYNGSTTPVKVAEDSYTGAAGGSQSVVFKLYRTGENVTFYAVPRNHNNAAPTPWTNSPYATHILGDVTAPAAPTGLAATNQPGGVLLTWNANTEKNLGAYKIYRNISNSFSGASLIDVIGVPRSGTPSDFDPTAVPNTQYYYFVTAVNTADMEGSNSASAGILATVAATLGSVTGTQRNLCPDSDVKFGIGSYWYEDYGTGPASPTSIVPVSGTGGNGFKIYQPTAWGTNGWTYLSASIPVTANQTYTISAYIDATSGAQGAVVAMNAPRSGGGLVQTSAMQTAGVAGRVSVSITPTATGNANLFLGFQTPSTVSGLSALFAAPQCEVGTVMTAYRPNALDDATGGLGSGILVQGLGGALGLQIGDVHDRANNAIDTGGNGYLIKGGLVRWRALGGDTSGDTSTDLVDSANKRFLHTAMSGGVRGVIDTTGYIYPASGLGTGYNANLGLIHDQATAPIICPTPTTKALPAFGSPFEFGTAFTVPSWVEWTAYVAGTVAEIVLDCGNFHGYGLRLDGRNGQPLVSIVRGNNFASLWDATIAQSSSINSAAVTGWFLLQAWVGRGGFMQLYLNGALACSVTDTTYTPNGGLWGQYEVGPASIGAASAATPDPTQLDGNARALIDGASAHVNWTQDYLPSGSVYDRTRIGVLDNGVPRSAFGKNLCVNPSFESNAVGAPLNTALASGAWICDNWYIASGVTGGVSFSLQNTGAYSGQNRLNLETNANAVINGNSFIGGKVFGTLVAVNSGEQIYAGAWYAVGSSVALPTGARGEARAGVEFVESDGQTIVQEQYNFADYTGQPSTGWAFLGGTWTVPSGAAYARPTVQMFCYAPSSQVTLGNGTAFQAVFDAFLMSSVANLDNEVGDGTTYARALVASLTSGVPKPDWWNHWFGLTPDTSNGRRFYPAQRTGNPVTTTGTYSSYPATSDVSFEFAVSVFSGSTYSTLEFYHPDASGHGYLFQFGYRSNDGNGPLAYKWDGTSFFQLGQSGSVVISDGNTHSGRIQTFANGQMDLYIDGALALRIVDTTYTPTGPWYLDWNVNVAYISNVAINGNGALANVASDNTGLTLGYSGYPQMVIGQGTITLPTGGAAGYQVKKTLYTAPTGTEANGTVISFSSLTDQSGNALPTFDTAPLVALQPYDMSTPPVLLYASGTTTTGFTLNSYSSAASKSGPGGTLVNGTDLTLTADAGTTFTGVSVTCSMTTKNITPYHPNVVQTFAISINDVSVGTITVSGAATGAEYQKSQNFSISGNPTSVKVSATWTLNGDASSASATVASTEISNPTAVSANIVCAISELWN